MCGLVVMTHLKLSPRLCTPCRWTLGTKHGGSSTECSGYFSNSCSHLLIICWAFFFPFQAELLEVLILWFITVRWEKPASSWNVFLAFCHSLIFAFFSFLSYLKLKVCVLHCPLSLIVDLQRSQMWLCSEQTIFHRSHHQARNISENIWR